MTRTIAWCLPLLVSLACKRDAGPHEQLIPQILSELVAGGPGPITVSPDGRLLLWRAPDPRALVFGVSELESDRSVTTFRIEDATLGGRAWRADSQQLAFLLGERGSAELHFWLLDVATGKTRKLAVPPTRGGSFRWAPHGSQIAYVRTLASTRDLVVFDAERPEPRVLVPAVSKKATFYWSPDATRLVTVQDADRGSVVIASLDRNHLERVQVSPGGEVRSLAWSPDGTELLMSVRASQAEYFELWRLDLATKTTKPLAKPVGDVAGPLYAPDSSIIYHLARNGGMEMIHANRDASEPRTIGVGFGISTITGFAPDGRAFFLHRGATTASALYELTIATDKSRLVRATKTPPGTPGTRLDIKAADGVTVPCVFWKSPVPSSERALVIFVHGSDGQTDLAWDPTKQTLLSHGLDVLSVDYRGSVGYGARYERFDQTGDAAIGDVSTAIKHATSALGFPAGRVFLMGASSGAGIAIEVAARQPNSIGGLVLLYTAPISSVEQTASFSGPVLTIHGSEDPRSPASIKKSITRRLGPVFDRSESAFVVMRDEGHIFHRTESLAEVFALIITTVRRR